MIAPIAAVVRLLEKSARSEAPSADGLRGDPWRSRPAVAPCKVPGWHNSGDAESTRGALSEGLIGHRARDVGGVGRSDPEIASLPRRSPCLPLDLGVTRVPPGEQPLRAPVQISIEEH